MGRREKIGRATQAKRELQGVRLGDVRLDCRLGLIVEALAKRPSASLPEAMRSEAALEATYRFLGNERVTPTAILYPHLEQTRVRCQQHERVFAVFDTTELRFGGEREGLGHLSHGRGLLAHVGIAVSADGKREPLGTLHLETLARQGEKKRRRNSAGKPDSEQLRWNRGVEAVHQALPSAICVMDREADVFALVEGMNARNQSFVVRATQNRNTDDGKLWDLLGDTQLAGTRSIDVAARRAAKRRVARERHPPRGAHHATLELRTRAVVLHEPDSTRSGTRRKAIATCNIHLVHVIERDVPAGDEPIEWVLLTNLPISTAQEVDFVVDAYRARWVIEEFFKALKSGCAIEKRQLESVGSVANVLAVSLPIAWLLLRLRSFSRDYPDRPANDLLSPLMMHCLRALHQQRVAKPLPIAPTCAQLLWAVAGLGGHIKNNGEPGTIVLGRGLAELLHAADVAQALGVMKL